MSLIICPECGKEFSDRASACPNCGCPTEDALILINQKKEQEKQIEDEKKESCPHCGSKSIGEDRICKSCGVNVDVFSKYVAEGMLSKRVDPIKPKDDGGIGFTGNPYVLCQNCGKHNQTGISTCQYCKKKISSNDYQVVDDNIFKPEEKKEFTGIYKYTLLGKKKEVYCPRCGSADCSHFREPVHIPGKTKTQYSANLNPFKPFTLVNKKEKVVRNEQDRTCNMIMCNSCGHTFF